METRARGWRRIAIDGGREVAAPATAAGADEPSPPTRIEIGCEIDGHLKLSGSLVVDGEFRGEITCREDVIVSEGGTVEAPISARSVVIHGAVVGDVQATREVLIHETGRLHGDVTTPSLVVERGAFFQGATRMYRPERIARRERGDDGAAAEPTAAAAPGTAS